MKEQTLTPVKVEITQKEALDAAIEIFQEKAETLNFAERAIKVEFAPPAAKKDVWRRRRYLAYVEKLKDIKRGLPNE